jgi:hypothetical protein
MRMAQNGGGGGGSSGAVWALNTNGQSGAACGFAAVIPKRVSQEMSQSVRS